MQHSTARGLAILIGLALPGTALAADHIEAPLASADPAADITDFYAWPTKDGMIVGILTFAGAGSSGAGAVYDPDVAYGFHIDNDGDNLPDIDIWARFGQSEGGDWGLQITNLPGGDAVVEGPVETAIDAGGGLSVWAGHAEDPFFFDLEGFNETLSTGAIGFTGADFFAGLNVTGIVIQMSAGAVVNADHDMQIWTTTSRK